MLSFVPPALGDEEIPVPTASESAPPVTVPRDPMATQAPTERLPEPTAQTTEVSPPLQPDQFAHRFLIGFGGELGLLTQSGSFNGFVDNLNSTEGGSPYYYSGYHLGHASLVYGVSAYAGYAFNEMWGLALSVDYQTANSSASGSSSAISGQTNSAQSTLQRTGVGVKALIQIQRSGSFVFYASPSVAIDFMSYGYSESVSISGQSASGSFSVSSTTLGAGLGVGMDYFVSNSFGLFAELGYQYANGGSSSVSFSQASVTGSNSTYSIGVPLNMSSISLTIGITGILGGWNKRSHEEPIATWAY